MYPHSAWAERMLAKFASALSASKRCPRRRKSRPLAFSWKELVTRVSEFVGDAKRKPEGRIARFADLFVDFVRLEVSRLSGEVIPMTNQEFKALNCFLSNPGRVLSRDELLNQAWGYENYPTTRTVDTHVAKLRQKLEKDPANPVHFRTVHRVGYKFVP